MSARITKDTQEALLHAGLPLQIVGGSRGTPRRASCWPVSTIFAGRTVTVRNENGFLVRARGPRPDSHPTVATPTPPKQGSRNEPDNLRLNVSCVNCLGLRLFDLNFLTGCGSLSLTTTTPPVAGDERGAGKARWSARLSRILSRNSNVRHNPGERRDCDVHRPDGEFNARNNGYRDHQGNCYSWRCGRELAVG